MLFKKISVHRDGNHPALRFKDMTQLAHHIFAVRAFFVFLVLVGPVWAHDGLHTPRMVTRVDAVTVEGRHVDVQFTITGLGDPLKLEAVHADGATALLGPLTAIEFAQDTGFDARLTFADTPPGIFALILDFGAAGLGVMTVIPEPATPLP